MKRHRTRCRLSAAIMTGLIAAALYWAPSASAAEEASLSLPQPHGVLGWACSDCHTEEGWRRLRSPLVFDHSATGFPLERSHQVGDCLSCHATLVFAHVPSACADCHDDAHEGELGPGCDQCHSPSTWTEARRTVFDRHAATLFPLTGAHTSADCESCHQDPPPFEFTNTPLDCVACHLEDYQQTTNTLDHIAAGFPTECQICHDTNTWQSARFGDGFHRAFFPLERDHAQLDCTECHIVPQTFSVFSCIDCHAHERDEMEDEHDDVSGYEYVSASCLACHPTGRE